MPHEQLNVLLVDAAIVSNAERLIESCEHCNRFAQIPLAWILDQITGCDRSVTDYLLERPAKCPKCGHDVLEKTRISRSGPVQQANRLSSRSNASALNRLA